MINNARNITYRGVVYPNECDHMQHMNVQFYAARFDEATWCLLTLLGMDRTYFNKTKTGMVALEARTAFKREVFAGECLYVQSSLNSIQNKTMSIKHVMKFMGTDEICAEMNLTGLHINAEARKGIPLPENINDLAKDFLAAE